MDHIPEPYKLRTIGFSAEQQTVIFVWLGANIFDNLFTFPAYTFLAKKEVAKAALVDLSKSVVNLALVVIFIFQWKTATAIAVAHAGGNVAGVLLSFYFFRGYPISKPSRELLSKYFQFIKPLLLVVVAMCISQNIGRVLVGNFYDVKEVGFLHAANRGLLQRFVHQPG